MKKAVFTTERITPLTVSLLAVSLLCVGLGMAHEFFGLALPYARVVFIVGPIATIALSLVLIRKIDWAR